MFRVFLLTTLLFSSFSSMAIDSLILNKSALLTASADIQPRFSLSHSNSQSSNESGFDISLLNESDMNFVTMNCEHAAANATNKCTQSSAPWVESSLKHKNNSHHGIGLFINSGKNLLAKLTDYEFKAEADIIYEYGVGYNYVVNNADASGLNFAAHVYRYNDKRFSNSDDASGISLQMGYQF